MEQKNNYTTRKDLFFVILLFIFIFLICLFNYFIDPYYIFSDSVIKGINNVKTHKYTNKRTIVYSDIKINSKNKETGFTGNCLLSHYGSGLDNVGFFTIPVAKVEEVAQIIKNIHEIAPNIKTIYWGLFYDDFCNSKNEEVTDSLYELKDKHINMQDLINLFFSFNTTKYSIDTLKDSVKNKGEDIIYVYPFREIAKKTYEKPFSFESLEKVREIKEFADKNNIKLIIYYSPIHITKKIHLFKKNQWENNMALKKKLAEITEFYDYSFANKYNTTPLDENNLNFIDNIHPSNTYNNLIVYDLLSDNKEIGLLVNTDNVDKILRDDTEKLKQFMDNNQELSKTIENVNKDYADIKVKRKNFNGI